MNYLKFDLGDENLKKYVWIPSILLEGLGKVKLHDFWQVDLRLCSVLGDIGFSKDI